MVLTMNLEHIEGWASCNCFMCSDDWVKVRAWELVLSTLESIESENVDSVARGKAKLTLNKLRRLE